ncbi:MAG: hypothetical protein IMZ61_03145 [Planctomycetes bacterium]|nr:hypothetical protein [Planctomycetota bacterium]
MECRIRLEMSTRDCLAAMCGGNPGALTVCMNLLKESAAIDPESALGGLGAVVYLDSFQIYEHRIWMLFKDVCKKNLSWMVGLIRACQLGIITNNALNHAIDSNGEGLDLPDVLKKTLERLPTLRLVDAEGKAIEAGKMTK